MILFKLTIFEFVVLKLYMITEDYKLWDQSTPPTNNESIFVHSLTVIKITLFESSLNITNNTFSYKVSF